MRHPIKNILVIRFSSLGDIVMATPMIRCLRKRFPDARIDMVIREDFLDLVRFNPHLNQIFSVQRNSGFAGLRKLARELKQRRYDLIYDAHWSLRSRYLMAVLTAPYETSFQKHYLRRSLALTLKLPLLRGAPRLISRYIEPLEKFGVRDDGLGPEVFIDEQAREAVRKLPFSQPIVGLIPSAQWPGKRWPTAYFKQVLRELLVRTSYQVVVFGGSKDFFCAEICEGQPRERVWNAQGKLSILEAAAVLRRCEFVVANDTGLMHLADAVGVPSVLVLGPTSRELGCLPFHPRTIVVEKNLWCRPCSKNGQAPCIRIRGRRECLEGIEPSDVLSASLRLAGVLA